MNVQWAVKGTDIYIIEVNPRASRTVPFVSKAIGFPLAQIAAKVMAGMTLKELEFTEEIVPEHLAVKHPVFPFNKFSGTDIILSPEMKSTGESLGIDTHLGSAFGKAYEATGNKLPLTGTVFISVKDSDKREVIPLARQLLDLGFKIISTRGTAKMLNRNGISCDVVKKIAEGRPNITDHLKNGDVQLVLNTPSGIGPRFDEMKIRQLTVTQGVSCITTLAAGDAIVSAIRAKKELGARVVSIQEYHDGTVK